MLALALVLPVVAAPALADQAPTEPEQHALDLINQLRTDMGRAPLLWDSRLADIAQWRSDYQAVNGFGHLSSWEPILSRMDAAGIAYDGYGEVLVLGTPRSPVASAEEAVNAWHNSSAHWEWLSSAEFDHLALGVATDANGWYYWTGLLLNAPDASDPPDVAPPAARITNIQMGVINDGRRRVTVTWSGENAARFRLQKRVNSGRWRAVTLWTLSTAKTFKLPLDKKYSFRVRARDAAGNKSAWSEVVVVAP